MHKLPKSNFGEQCACGNWLRPNSTKRHVFVRHDFLCKFLIVKANKENEFLVVDKELENSMDVIRRISDACLSARSKSLDKKGIAVKIPVSECLVTGNDSIKKLLEQDELVAIIRDVTNIDYIKYIGLKTKIKSVTPNKSKIGQSFKGLSKRILSDIESVENIKETIVNGNSYETKDYGLTPDMFNFEYEIPENTSHADFDGGTVFINTTISPNAKSRGYTREFSRFVQELRRSEKLNPTQFTKVEIITLDLDKLSNLNMDIREIEKRTKTKISMKNSQPTEPIYEIEDVKFSMKIVI